MWARSLHNRTVVRLSPRGNEVPDGTADSCTRNVKSDEASHIKIAGVPCQQQALTAGRTHGLPNSCQTYSERGHGGGEGGSNNRRTDQHEEGGRRGNQITLKSPPSSPPFCSSHGVRKQLLFPHVHLMSSLRDEDVVRWPRLNRPCRSGSVDSWERALVVWSRRFLLGLY